MNFELSIDLSARLVCCVLGRLARALKTQGYQRTRAAHALQTTFAGLLFSALSFSLYIFWLHKQSLLELRVNTTAR